LKIPVSIEQATKEYRRESDTLLLFFERRCVFGVSEWVSRKDFNDNLKGFCEKHKFYHPGAIEVAERLKTTDGVTEGRHGDARGWKGLRLTKDGWDLDVGPEPKKEG